MNQKTSKNIRFLPVDRVITTSRETTLLDLALDAKIEINHSCGGMGSCGTCCVEIVSSATPLPERNEVESEMAADRGFHDFERLACQLDVHSDMTVKIK